MPGGRRCLFVSFVAASQRCSAVSVFCFFQCRDAVPLRRAVECRPSVCVRVFQALFRLCCPCPVSRPSAWQHSCVQPLQGPQSICDSMRVRQWNNFGWQRRAGLNGTVELNCGGVKLNAGRRRIYSEHKLPRGCVRVSSKTLNIKRNRNKTDRAQ